MPEQPRSERRTQNRVIAHQINRQLSGWFLPPLVFRAFGAHCRLLAMNGRSRPSCGTSASPPEADVQALTSALRTWRQRPIFVGSKTAIPTALRTHPILTLVNASQPDRFHNPTVEATMSDIW
jgi:hypothetical protein